MKLHLGLERLNPVVLESYFESTLSNRASIRCLKLKRRFNVLHLSTVGSFKVCLGLLILSALKCILGVCLSTVPPPPLWGQLPEGVVRSQRDLGR